MRIPSLKVCALFFAALFLCAPSAFPQNNKDYISSTETDKIREAIDPNERIRLFLSFAADRLKQLQYELEHPANNVRRAERLNGLLNGFSGCLDEAVDRMELGVEKQEDVREGIKAVQTQAPQFLTYLTDSAAKSPESKSYKKISTTPSSPPRKPSAAPPIPPKKTPRRPPSAAARNRTLG